MPLVSLGDWVKQQLGGGEGGRNKNYVSKRRRRQVLVSGVGKGLKKQVMDVT